MSATLPCPFCTGYPDRRETCGCDDGEISAFVRIEDPLLEREHPDPDPERTREIINFDIEEWIRDLQ